ncbi:membrane protein insertase YidC [Anaeromyxobacter sp. Fw109-5]|uniref:Membrane protein insertase YidC n=1 Tax=Anaeromyxobacter sp. (strain Fw109-5) TaxID=404589 RepID=YIDC_ANADF|nr:membrane protein insertase YidC [Anaeromyxobacter sp. Fw109-5]A7HIY8.1 RecName: Full=Membrane protein insertase YidC; AltName: Full=Foldase YidC; AltName: Full=Membrane integrase YidC; AltName: Full=Membrane protein YidC [Anaeromyxobacter sp. Fw109-5]ABS28684.1 60 kDa inner membrane insertion protein [Anaeromyxobacter sp. Fw109-5]
MGPENRRVLLATVLSVAVLIVWQFVFPSPKPKPQPPKPPEAAQRAEAPAAPAPGQPAAQAPAPAVPQDAPEQLVKLVGDGFEATLTSHGGAVKEIVLQGEKFRRDREGKPVQIDLVRVAKEQPYPLAVVATPELGGAEDAGNDVAARAPMRVVAQDARSATFEGRAGKATVRKTYRLTEKAYELALDLEVQAPATQGGGIVVLYPGYMPPDTKKGGFFSGPPVEFVRPVCRAGEETERFDVDGKEAQEKLQGTVAWAGMDQGYFVSAVFPAQPAGTCLFAKGPVQGSGLTALRLPLDGGSAKFGFTVYSGPKDLDHLRTYGREFESAIDYGAMARPFAFFARLLLFVMRWLERLVANWGLAIILLTVLVKVLLYPLTAKSMQSMNEMRKLQPEIEKLKAKHGNDREKLNLATMQLYQQHKVNPLGGCLPMLIQLPIWFALYATLQTSVELYREPFLWIHDLTVKDPLYVLPIAMGVSQYVMQRFSPQPADNAQAKMMLYFMPGFFTLLMLSVPAGLTLYIFVNNLLSIAQQQFMMRRMPAVPAPAKASK